MSKKNHKKKSQRREIREMTKEDLFQTDMVIHGNYLRTSLKKVNLDEAKELIYKHNMKPTKHFTTSLSYVNGEIIMEMVTSAEYNSTIKKFDPDRLPW